MLSEIKQRLGGASFLVLDTDEKTVKRAGRKMKTIIFGRESAQGLGCGMDIELAKKAVLEDKEKLRKIFSNQDLIVFVSALGGGVGSGAGPILAEIAKEEKALSLGFFTLPFEFEGEKRMKIARKAIIKLKENLSGVIAVENEKIFNLVDRKMPLKKALAFLDSIFSLWLTDLMEVILKPSLINIDFADLKTILKDRNNDIFLGQAMAQGPNRVEEILKQLFSNPIFENSPKRANRLVFNISGSRDLKLKEVESISSAVAELNPKAKIIFGVSENKNLANNIKLILLAVSSADNNLVEAKPKKKRKKSIFNKAKSLPANGKKESKKKPEKPEEDNKEEAKRKSALKAKEEKEEEDSQEWETESTWEVPAFLKK